MTQPGRPEYPLLQMQLLASRAKRWGESLRLRPPALCLEYPPWGLIAPVTWCLEYKARIESRLKTERKAAASNSLLI